MDFVLINKDTIYYLVNLYSHCSASRELNAFALYASCIFYSQLGLLLSFIVDSFNLPTTNTYFPCFQLDVV